MTRDEIRSLAADADRVDRYFPLRNAWLAPASVTLKFGALHFSRVRERRVRAVASSDLLGRFIELSDAPETRILRFARRWGSLDLCSVHDALPASHNEPPFRVGEHTWCEPSAVESISRWSEFAQRFGAIAVIA